MKKLSTQHNEYNQKIDDAVETENELLLINIHNELACLNKKIKKISGGELICSLLQFSQMEIERVLINKVEHRLDAMKEYGLIK